MTRRLHLILAALLLAISIPAAFGKDPAVVPLADTMYHLDEVGMSIRLPLDSVVNSTWAGDVRTPQVIAPGAEYVINIQMPKTANPKATIKEAADQTIALIQGSVGVVDPDQKTVLQTEAKLLDRTPNLKIGDQDAERFYLSIPAASGEPLVKGYTIFKPAANQFVVFELVVKEARFAKARRAYETSLATVTFVDPVQVSLQRGAAIRAGQELFKLVSDADMDAMCDGKERWYRLYTPAATASRGDAEEVGYRGIRLWKGQRGEIDPNSNRGSWSKTEREEGYLASVRARVMTPQGPADSEATYFLSKDKQRETWMLRMVLRDAKGQKELLTARELGGREGKEMTVSIEQTGQAPRSLAPFFQSDGYLSQVQVLMLPRVFATKQVESEFGYYTYQSQIEGVSLRRDRVNRAGRGTSTVWTVETSYSDDAPTQTSTYNAKGELLSTSTGDGRVWEPVELDDLKHLWEAKGLPTTTPRRR